jgi:hypothetical protein
MGIIFQQVAEDISLATPHIEHVQYSIDAFKVGICRLYRSQWPRCVRHGSVAARLLGLWVQIPPAAWRSLSCECCVLSDRGLCVGLITRPEGSYRVWCVLV